MVGNLERLARSLRTSLTLPRVSASSFSNSLSHEEVVRAMSEMSKKGQTVVSDRNGNRFLVTRRGR